MDTLCYPSRTCTPGGHFEMAQQQSSHGSSLIPNRQVMSVVPRTNAWCKVSPVSTQITVGSEDSSQVVFEPSVLSFRNFTYVGKTIPRQSMPPLASSNTTIINPFQGFLLFCHWNAACQASESDSIHENHTDVITDSKKDDNVAIGNRPDTCEYVYERCELDYVHINKGDDEEDKMEEDKMEDDDDSVVEFESSCSAVIHCPNPLILSHTFSFSSEESGFCDQSHTEWSDDDDDFDSPECNFDEGLWHDFERQACFTGIPLKNGRNKKTCSKQIRSSSDQISTKQCRVTINEQDNIVHNLSVVTSSSTKIHSTGSQHIQTSYDEHSTVVVPAKNCRNKVTFKPDSELVTVHCIVAWKYAYRACRKGPWEQYAVDRERFNKRIQAANAVLAPCLLEKLRATQITKMYD